jgi:single-stranded DNA-specific DHH superfamily exonuclease
MLTDKQILEIREHLEKALNPVFFYDNDLDGLSSYVLLRRYINRGRGVAIRTHPVLDVGYAKRVQQLNADYVFVLDRPKLGKEFVEEIEKMQVPIVWIDHHDIDEEKFDYENIFQYNPTNSKEKKSNEPVTYWSYRITNRKEDMWIAIMGCIADHYMPDFAEEFSKNYPEYWKIKKNVTDPFHAYYKTEIGFLARALGFGLKDSMTHVIYMQNFLINCKGPSDAFLELESRSSFARKYQELRKKYDVLLEKAKKEVEGDVVFFTYGGNLSISADISNELSFLYPNHFVVVAYSTTSISNLSIRGDDVRGKIEKILPKIESASGGGHRDAVGVRVDTTDLERFKNEFVEEVNRKRNGL